MKDDIRKEALTAMMERRRGMAVSVSGGKGHWMAYQISKVYFTTKNNYKDLDDFNVQESFEATPW